MNRRLVIVGGSYAALNAAAAAREGGFDDAILMIGEEALLPYQRPPLSKAFLKGDAPAEDLPLKSEAFYRDNRIEPLLRTRVERLDLGERRVRLAGGGAVDFDLLVLACGARPRRLTSGEDAGVVYLRAFDDAVRLKDRLQDARSVAILGGGFIGLEVAAVAAAMGKTVRLVEAGSRLLARAVPPEISALLDARHRDAGVEMVRAAVASVDGRLVRLTNGDSFEADLVVAGLGATPNAELAAEAGLAVGDGIETDEYGRTSAPGVFAVGDCSSHMNLWAGRRMRLESVQNAADQARAAGFTLAGRPTAYRAAPRFWSDQYDLKLQMVGLAAGADRTEPLGPGGAGVLSLLHLEGDAVVAVTSLNDPRTQVWARRALAEGPVPRALLNPPFGRA